MDTPLPSVTPTLDPPITRTPAPAAQCPRAGGQPPGLVYSESPPDLETQIAGYLNATGSAAGLQAALTRLGTTVGGQPENVRAQVVTQDVTGDQVPDVIVDLFHPTGRVGDLLIYACRASRYELIRQPIWSSLHDRLRAVADLNRDGVPEVVFTWLDCGAGCLTNFVILEWNGDHFADLSAPVGPYGGPSVWGGDGVVQDTDGNGTRELVLTEGWSPSYGPGRKRHDVWAWNGQAFTLHRSYYDPPVWRFQAVYDGDDAARAGDYAAALAAYQRTVFDEALFSWGWDQDPLAPQAGLGRPFERPLLSAYARYRILLVHLVQGHAAEARTVYDTLRDRFPAGVVGSPFADLAAVLWDEYQNSGSTALACGRARAYAATRSEEILTPLSWPAYGDNEMRTYAPEDICPFR